MLLLLSLALPPLATLADDQQSIAFAPLPMETPEIVAAQWKPLLDQLGKTLGRPVRIDYSDNYATILEKFRAGKLDLAYLGPLPYVALKEQFPAATPIVHFNEKDGLPTYTCAIVALDESRLALKDLRGKRIALTQPLSTCGYMTTDGLLRRAGSDLEKNRYRYLDKHDSVAVAVARGDYEAGGLKTAIARKYLHLGLRIIVESPPLPAFALIANSQRVPASRQAEIRDMLLRADPGQRSGWGENLRNGVTPASDRDYEPVRKLRQSARIPEKGNF